MGFAYDANGRVVKATKANTPDATTVYDALGNRVATKTGGVWQYMIYDAFGKLVAEYGVPNEGMGGVKYVQQDHQGSVRTVTNANGFVVARTDHQAFGDNVGSGVGLRTTSQGYGAEASTRQGYGLTEIDDATGQQHTWFRKLETQAGRWSSPDPYDGSMSIGDPQSFNRYAYVESQPTNFVDPRGLQINMYSCIPWDGYQYCHLDMSVSGFGGLGGLPDRPIREPQSPEGPVRDKSDDNKLNNCMINAMGDWARANGRAYSDFKRSSVRTAGLTVLGAIIALEAGAIILGGGSAYFGYQDYQIALGRNNDDLARDTRKCLADNPNASKSARNRAINEANTNIGGTPIPYIR